MDKLKSYIIIVLGVGLIVMYFILDKPRDTTAYQNRIDSLEAVTAIQNQKIGQMLDDAVEVEIDQVKFEEEIDSLQQLLGVPNLPCPEENVLLTQQNTALKGALVECNKAKGIYVKTIKEYQGLVVNNELICLTKDQMYKVEVKNCKKKWKFWFGSGFVVGYIAGVFTPR